MQVVIQTDDNTQYDLYSDLGWICDYPSNMGAPQVRTNYKIIPGRNGVLDLTEIDGNLYYEDVEFAIEAQKLLRTSEDIIIATSELMNLFNGQRVRVILNNSSYYYDARISVGTFVRTGINMTVSLNIQAFPYRLQITPTTVTATLSPTEQTITLLNGTMQLVPSITTTGTATIVYENNTYTISSGTNIQIPNMILHEGSNTMTATGTGNITFTYTQGIF